MFGDISAWFIEYAGGIRPGAPGYKTVIIKPEVMNSLTWATASHNSPYGMISSAWQANRQTVNLNVTIPPNSTARICLPILGAALTKLVIQESGVTIWRHGGATANVPGVAFDHYEGKFPQSYLVWTVTSGSYRFSWHASPVLSRLEATPRDHLAKLR
jgi:alpha-L-rhamnosidase